MKSTGRDAIRRTRLPSSGGGIWFEKSAVPAVMTSVVGISPHLSAARRGRDPLGSSESPRHRRPLPRGRRDCAAVCSSVSPPTDRPMPPIRLRSTSGAALQEGDGGVQVLLRSPAEDVRVALALTLAATVEEQDAIAVADEHPRRLLRIRPARCRDHGSTVPGRHVPAMQRQPVAGPERHLLVGGAEPGRRHRGARRVREDIRQREREQHDVCRNDRERRQQQPTHITPETMIVPASRRPQGHGPDAGQQEARRNRQQSCVVVPGRPDRDRVVAGLAQSRDDAEQPERDRKPSAKTCPEATVAGDEDPEQCDGHEAADQVVER